MLSGTSSSSTLFGAAQASPRTSARCRPREREHQPRRFGACIAEAVHSAARDAHEVARPRDDDVLAEQELDMPPEQVERLILAHRWLPTRLERSDGRMKSPASEKVVSGRMFWFRWKKLSGSYSDLILFSRRKMSSP